MRFSLVWKPQNVYKHSSVYIYIYQNVNHNMLFQNENSFLSKYSIICMPIIVRIVFVFFIIQLHADIANCKEQSPWEANSHSVSQIPHVKSKGSLLRSQEPIIRPYHEPFSHHTSVLMLSDLCLDYPCPFRFSNQNRDALLIPPYPTPISSY
jgi:hypothetical protein